MCTMFENGFFSCSFVCHHLDMTIMEKDIQALNRTVKMTDPFQVKEPIALVDVADSL